MAKTIAGTKRGRQDRIYQDKSKLRESLGFDTDQSFDTWRSSSLVKPWWDSFLTACVEKSLETGKKVIDEQNLMNRIREGERLGKMKYSAEPVSPSYTDAEDCHAWLVFWLAFMNVSNRNGCLWNKRFEKHQAWSAMHKFVLWAKRLRIRNMKKKPMKTRKAGATESAPEAEQSEHESENKDEDEEEDEDMDPRKGIAIVMWREGLPDTLVLEGNAGRATLNNLCSHDLLSFWKAVDEAFELPKHMQRRCYLGPRDGSTFRDAQVLANKDQGQVKIIFYLDTERSNIPEEAVAVPDSTVPTDEGNVCRESFYRDMVDEAAQTGASRLDMSVRLWKYNLMQAVASDTAHVNLMDVHLDLEGDTDKDDQDDSAEIQAIQYTHDLKSLNYELSGEGDDSDDGVGDGLPLTHIKDITPGEIERYHERNKWIDNPAYQPQNHLQACQNLGIPNPQHPRIDGLRLSMKFDLHQPTAINALVEFEDSSVGGALNAEEVGLGKTVEMIGLLLHRSNQRKAAIAQGENVTKALPTLVILPQNLIQQWRDEIFEFTDRFTVCIYYGPHRKSTDEQLVYIPKSETKGRLSRSHRFFSGAEENSDVIILTSYATWASRHGPRGQWDWLCEQRRNAAGGVKPTKKQAEKFLMDSGITYHSIDISFPHQLFGLFERVILDEGHTIRHQSHDIGWAVSNTGSRYRHILTGTPTFDNIKEFSGLMRFLQNPKLSDKQFLLGMNFTEDELTTGTDKELGNVTFLESAVFWGDPYLLEDDDPRAVLKYTAKAMDKYLFNDVYNSSRNFDVVEKGRRLSQVLKKVMLRRTHSSILNGMSIGRSLPSVQRMIFECGFTETERAHYDFMMQDDSTTLFKVKKGKKDESVEWSTTAYRKWSLLASWLGFQYLLDYKASSLRSKRKNMSAVTILRDVQKGQQRMKVPKEKQLPLQNNADSVQKILEQHCTGSPKLRQLLGILAEIVVLRKEKMLLWVNSPAQAEWLEHVLRLCGVETAQLRTDLKAGEQDSLLRDFTFADGKIQYCRTSTEFDPPPNESVRKQELGRVRRRGQPSDWVRHITLLTKDTLNTKQDSASILKNLPNLLTQLNMDVWGKGDESEKTYALGDFVLHNENLLPADDARVEGLGLAPLGAGELLMQIQLQLSGRTSTATLGSFRKQAETSLLPRKAAIMEPLETQIEAPEEPLWP